MVQCALKAVSVNIFNLNHIARKIIIAWTNIRQLVHSTMECKEYQNKKENVGRKVLAHDCIVSSLKKC